MLQGWTWKLYEKIDGKEVETGNFDIRSLLIIYDMYDTYIYIPCSGSRVIPNAQVLRTWYFGSQYWECYGVLGGGALWEVLGSQRDVPETNCEILTHALDCCPGSCREGFALLCTPHHCCPVPSSAVCGSGRWPALKSDLQNARSHKSFSIYKLIT